MIYWALEEFETLARELEARIDSFDKEVGSTVGPVWERNRRYYYAGLGSEALSFEGEQGELVKAVANQLRLIIRQQFAIVSKNKLDFEPTTRTSDGNVIADMKLVKSLVKHIIKDQRLNKRADKMLEGVYICGLYYLVGRWRTDRGDVVANDEQGTPVFAGDLEIAPVHPRNVGFDTSIHDFWERDWHWLRTAHNRHSLAAQYPQLEDQIKLLPAVKDRGNAPGTGASYQDSVWVYEFFHRKTPALPTGRYTVFCDSKTKLFDDENIYETWPIVECKPEPIEDTPWGYTPMNDLVSLQELYDVTISVPATNISEYGVGALLNPEGNDVSVEIIQGKTFINYKPQNATGGGKPEPLAWPQTPAENYKFHEVIKTNMMEIGNINSTLRGTPPAQASGALAATLSANALEFIAPIGKEFYRALEEIMEKAVWCYKTFAKTEKIISIAGPSRMNEARAFTGAQLPTIDRMEFPVTSALASTAAGKDDIAEKLIKAGLIRTPQRLFEVLATGNMDNLYAGELSQIELINSENERLREGKKPRVSPTDIHPQHEVNHASVINDPRLRELADDETNTSEEAQMARMIVQATADHILEHEAERTKPGSEAIQAIMATGQAPQLAPAAPQGAA